MRTTHIHAGFLSDVVQDYPRYFDEHYGHWETLFREVNTFACAVRLKLPIGKDQKAGVRNLLSACVFSRLLDSYQCVLILLKHGAGDEAKSQLRSVLESLFVLGANLRLKTFARRYILADEDARRHMGKNALSASRKAKRLKREEFWDEKQRKEIQKQVTKLEAQRKARKLPSMFDYLPKKNAKAGGPLMVFEYEKAYAYLCSYAHVGIGGVLEKYLKVDGGKIRLEIGPSTKGASVICRTAIDILLLSLELLNRHHKLCVSYQITKFRQRIEDLR